MIFISQCASLHFAFGSGWARSLARFQETTYATASETSFCVLQSDFAYPKSNSYMDGMRIRVKKWRKSSASEHDRAEYGHLCPSKMKMVHKTTVPRAFRSGALTTTLLQPFRGTKSHLRPRSVVMMNTTCALRAATPSVATLSYCIAATDAASASLK